MISSSVVLGGVQIVERALSYQVRMNLELDVLSPGMPLVFQPHPDI